jgi:hypothetical protein
MLLSTASCADGPAVVDSFCVKAEPFYLDPGDVLTRSTKEMVLRHNRTGQRDCGWEPIGP